MSDLEIAAVDRRSEPIAPAPQRRPSGLSLDRVIDINLLLMILLIGVPVLVACVLSPAG